MRQCGSFHRGQSRAKADGPHHGSSCGASHHNRDAILRFKQNVCGKQVLAAVAFHHNFSITGRKAPLPQRSAKRPGVDFAAPLCHGEGLALDLSITCLSFRGRMKRKLPLSAISARDGDPLLPLVAPPRCAPCGACQ